MKSTVHLVLPLALVDKIVAVTAQEVATRSVQNCYPPTAAVTYLTEEETIESKNSVLLGIKYEAARIGDVGEAALAGIEEQIRREVGDGWESDDRVLRGRNAVRREHGLPGLGEPGDRPSPATDPIRPLWRRLFGR